MTYKLKQITSIQIIHCDKNNITVDVGDLQRINILSRQIPELTVNNLCRVVPYPRPPTLSILQIKAYLCLYTKIKIKK